MVRDGSGGTVGCPRTGLDDYRVTGSLVVVREHATKAVEAAYDSRVKWTRLT